MTTTQRNAPASARQQLVEVAGIPGYMATKTGGEISAEVGKVWDGGATQPETLSGPAETANVVVSKPYRPGIHGALLAKLARQVGAWRTTVSVYDTDPDLGPIGKPRVYANALLVRLAWPDGDASSSDASSFELEFAVPGLAGR